IAKEPPASLARAIKRAITQDAGLSLKVDVRFAANAEAEQTESQEQAPTTETSGTVPETPPAPPPQAPKIPMPPAPPAPGSEAAFKNRLKVIQAKLVTAGGPTPDQQMLLNQAFSAARDRDFAAA